MRKMPALIENIFTGNRMHCDMCDKTFIHKPSYYQLCSLDCTNKYYWYRCDKCAKVECFGTCKKGVDY